MATVSNLFSNLWERIAICGHTFESVDTNSKNIFLFFRCFFNSSVGLHVLYTDISALWGLVFDQRRWRSPTLILQRAIGLCFSVDTTIKIFRPSPLSNKCNYPAQAQCWLSVTNVGPALSRPSEPRLVFSIAGLLYPLVTVARTWGGCLDNVVNNMWYIIAAGFHNKVESDWNISRSTSQKSVHQI